MPTRLAHKGGLPLAGALLFFVTLWVYRPGLSGTFLFDDYHNLVDNQAVQLDALSWSALGEAARSGDAGPLGRPVSMLSFAVNHYLTGPAPYGYLVGNLLVHLLCGGAVYWLTCLLLAACRRRCRMGPASGTEPWLALLVSAAWLLHPINLTSVLYVVQRMTSLAALFTFLSLALYLRGRLNQMADRRGWPAILTMALVTAPLALFSKENAALLPVLIGLTEWLILDFRAASPALARGLRRSWAVALATVVVGGLAVWLFKSDLVLGGYSTREFTLTERLLTEARVIWIYVGLIVLPSVSRLGLYHDDIPLSVGVFAPPETALAVLGLMAAIVAALAWRRRFPFLAWGVLFFLVGHGVESTVLPLEIAHEHRNYLPAYGLLFGVFAEGARLERSLVLRRVLAGLWLLGIVAVTALRADLWGQPADFIVVNARYHPDSARSLYEAGRMYYKLAIDAPPEGREAYYRETRDYLLRTAEVNEGFAAALLSLLRLDAVLGRPFDPGLYGQALDQLRAGYVSTLTVETLQGLNSCQLQGGCPLSPQIMAGLLDAVLTNSSLDTKRRAILLTEQAIRALADGQVQAAVASARQARDLDPKNPRMWFNLLTCLIESKRLDEAKSEVGQLEQQGFGPVERAEAAALREVIVGRLAQ